MDMKSIVYATVMAVALGFIRDNIHMGKELETFEKNLYRNWQYRELDRLNAEQKQILGEPELLDEDDSEDDDSEDSDDDGDISDIITPPDPSITADPPVEFSRN